MIKKVSDYKAVLSNNLPQPVHQSAYMSLELGFWFRVNEIQCEFFFFFFNKCSNKFNK